MTWAQRLRERRGHDENILESPPASPTEPTEPTCGGFVGTPEWHSGKVVATLRQRLLDLAAVAGVDLALVDHLDDADVAVCDGEADTTLIAYIEVLARRRDMARGLIPDGWTQTVECLGCGPVRIWPECPPKVIACPWCAIRKAKTPPRTPSPI